MRSIIANPGPRRRDNAGDSPLPRSSCRVTAMAWLGMALLFLVLADGQAWAVSPYMTYQGYLEDAQGAAVTDPALAMTFRIYDASSGGALAWSQSQSVDVQEGLYSVLLGCDPSVEEDCTFMGAVLQSGPYWLEVEAGGEILSPRARLTSGYSAFRSFYAVSASQADSATQANDADTLDGKHASEFLDSTTGGAVAGDLSLGGNLGVGAAVPESQLHVSAGTSGDAKLILEADTDNNDEGDQPVIEFRQDGGLIRGHVGFEGGGNDLRISNKDGVSFYGGDYTSRVLRMRLMDTGNLGIGPNALLPGERLAVDGNVQIVGAGHGLMLPDGSKLESAAGSPYGNVLVVAKSGGDYTSIQAALDSITDAADTNRYLIWVGPGVYSERVVMKAYVDLHGAGESMTTITATGGSGLSSSATLIAASYSGIRHLTVENTGDGSAYGVAVYMSGKLATSLTDMTATAKGGVTENHGIYAYNSYPTIKRVTAKGYQVSGMPINHGIYMSGGGGVLLEVEARGGGATTAYGIHCDGSVLEINQSYCHAGTANLEMGLYATNGSEVTVRDSRFYGKTASVSNQSSTVKVANSRLDSSAGSFLTCVNCYDTDFAALDTACQTP